MPLGGLSVPRDNSRVSGAVSGEVSAGGQVVTSPVRKERLDKSKRELEKEAARVLHQVDRLDCITNENSVSPEKFYTLPRKKPKEPDFSSLGRRTKRRIPPAAPPEPPQKPPRTFANHKPSVFDVFKRKTLGRSVSDASALRRRTSGEATQTAKKEKKQLSPIIELSPKEDYFEGVEDKENRDGNVVVKRQKKKEKESVTEQLKKFIDEVDEELYRETGVRVQDVERPPVPIIIDVDKAEKISTTPSKKKRFRGGLGKKLKSIARKEKKRKSLSNEAVDRLGTDVAAPEERHIAPKIKRAIQDLNRNADDAPKMIHSSQKPAEKLPLTKGRTVDPLVKYLSNDKCSSPPPLNKTNVMITPHGSVQHNNNQPFSYTRGVSPEKPHSPVIYAQVVCGAPGKHTVHAAFNNGRRHPHSDSDEGLGGEDTSGGFGKKIGGYDDVDHVAKYEEESLITPKFRNPAYVNGYSNGYLDSSNRGRADGMDSKRRESLTEAQEPRQANGRSDLSARRDLLESRINRRLNDNTIRTSPEYLKGSAAAASPPEAPAGYYGSGPRRYHQVAKDGYHYDSEPKSFDSQASDYRSSPDYNASTTIYKYKSTPEISLYHHHHHHQEEDRHQSYSLRREKADGRVVASGYSEEGERKEKFVDSGIENDFRRDSSGEHFRPRSRPVRYSNESEDEGFASSLLIASERQHTEDSHRRNFDKKTRDHVDEAGEYRQRFRSSDYMPRERSIDDGSHYDPRIDKDADRTLKRVVDKKPPKPEKRSGLDKVKSLFTRDSKKKKEKQQSQGLAREESLRARYVEYKGREMVESKYKKKEYNNDYQANYDYSPRKRYQSPSPSPTRQNSAKTPVQRNGKLPENGGWFKSLDRLSRKKNKKDDKDALTCSGTEEESSKPTPTKNLRFFGDTDIESNDSSRHQKPSALRHRSQSTRDLHKETERMRSPEPLGARKTGHKSLTNITEQIDARESRSSLKPPMSPTHRVPRDTSRQERSRRRKNEVSSVESSTEGDSSQQSQRSIVYLHAATVGDIPGPGYLRNGRRAASREELASNGSSRIQPHVKTLSRSFSVLAPWRPRHPREGVDLDYSQYPKKNGKYEQRASKVASSRKDGSSTLKKKAQETRKNQSTASASSTTLNRRSRSKENLSASSQTLRRSREELSRGSSSTLYKKKERLPRENSRYSSRVAADKDERKMSSKSLSVESLRRSKGGGGGGGGRGGEEGRDVSRSVSMPRDPEKSAGWFKMSRKKTSSSAQRL